MGLSVPTISDATPALVGGALVAPAGGLRGWLATLSPRDRTIYAIMLGMLALIVAIYLLAGLQTLVGRSSPSTLLDQPTSAPATAQQVVAAPTRAATTVPATPTDIPTSTPSPQPTDEPTQAPFLLQPTQVSTAPTATATGTIDAFTTNTASSIVPAATSAASPSAAPVATSAAPSATSAPAASPLPPRPTQAPPQPTQAPPPRPTLAPSPRPTQAPPRPTQAPPQPTQAPPVSTSTQVLTLYFADASGRMYVPVQRRATVENNQVAKAAIRELIAGPRNGLGRLVLPDVQLLDIQIDGGTATVNFNRRPTGEGDERGFTSIVLTLTHFSGIQRVQFQINGQNVGGPRARPIVNPINPQSLPQDYGKTEFLPIYFVAADGRHDIRLIRLVPKTDHTAEATVRALLEGPGEYGSAVQRVIPAGTELRGIRLEKGTIIVDFTQPFAGTADRAAAVRTVVESLTTLKTVSGVLFLVEGHSLGDQWGGDYGKVFGRPLINSE